jgi:hypothetical protein
MTVAARLRRAVIVGALVLALLLVLFAPRLLKPSPKSISVAVVRFTQDAAGSRLAVVQFVNRTSAALNYNFAAQVRKEGAWTDAAAQHEEGRMANSLPPKFERTIEVPVPEDGDAWRIELVTGRVLGNFEVPLYRLANRLKMRYPLAPDLYLYSETNGVVKSPNQSRQPTAAPSLDIDRSR